MKRCKWADTEEIAKLSHVEICPKAMDLTQTIAKRIGLDGGAALIIDYGLNGMISDSLQVVGLCCYCCLHALGGLKLCFGISEFFDIFWCKIIFFLKSGLYCYKISSRIESF